MNDDQDGFVLAQERDVLGQAVSDSASIASKDFPLGFSHLTHSQGAASIPELELNTPTISALEKRGGSDIRLAIDEVNEKDDLEPALERSRFRSFDSVHIDEGSNQGDRLDDFHDFNHMGVYSPTFGPTKYTETEVENANEQGNWNLSSAFMAAREKFTQIASKIQSSYTAGRKALQDPSESMKQDGGHQIVPSLLPYDLDSSDKLPMADDPLDMYLGDPADTYKEIFDMHSEISGRGASNARHTNASPIPPAIGRPGTQYTTSPPTLHPMSLPLPGTSPTSAPSGYSLGHSLQKADNAPMERMADTAATANNTSKRRTSRRTRNTRSSLATTKASSASTTPVLMNTATALPTLPTLPTLTTLHTLSTPRALSTPGTAPDTLRPVPGNGSTITSSTDSDEEEGTTPMATRLRRSTRKSRSRIRYRDEDFDYHDEDMEVPPARKGRRVQRGTSRGPDKKKKLNSLESLLLQRGDPLKQRERTIGRQEGDSGDSPGDDGLPVQRDVPHMAGTTNTGHVAPGHGVQGSVQHEWSGPMSQPVPGTPGMHAVDPANVLSSNTSAVNPVVSPVVASSAAALPNSETTPLAAVPPDAGTPADPMNYYLSSVMTQSLLGSDSAQLLMTRSEEAQRQMLLHQMLQMLQAENYDPDELRKHIVEYKDLHASFGVKCWEALQIHINAIRDLLCPDTMTRMSLWTISHADGTTGERLPSQLLSTFRVATEKVRNQTGAVEGRHGDAASSGDTHNTQNQPNAKNEELPGVGVGVWAQVVSHCALTEAQQKEILTLSDTVRKRREHMISLFQKIEKLEKEITQNFLETENIMRDLTSVLSPEQVVRFYEFTERSKTLFDVVSSLRSWPMPPENEIRPTASSPNNSFVRDLISFQTAYANIMTKISGLLGEHKKEHHDGQTNAGSPDSNSASYPGSSVWKNLVSTVGSALHEKAFTGLPHIPVSWVSHLVGNFGLGVGNPVTNAPGAQRGQLTPSSGHSSASDDTQHQLKAFQQAGLPALLDLSSAGKALDAAAETAGMYVAKASAAAELAANHAKNLSSVAADRAVSRAKQLSDTAASAASLFCSTVLGYSPTEESEQVDRTV